MVISIKLDVEKNGIEQYLQKLQSELDSFLYGQGIKLSSYVKEKKLSGQALHVRTGRLRNSFGNFYSKDGIFKVSHGRVVVGTSVKYARIHEYGGIITAKGGKYLAIPLPAVLTPAGVPRYTWRKRGDIPRQFPNAFVMRGKRGGLLLAEKRGKKIVPLFLLKRSVTIKRKWYLHSAVKEYKKFFKKDMVEFLKGIK